MLVYYFLPPNAGLPSTEAMLTSTLPRFEFLAFLSAALPSASLLLSATLLFIFRHQIVIASISETANDVSPSPSP